jgi:hypothetical protein
LRSASSAARPAIELSNNDPEPGGRLRTFGARGAGAGAEFNVPGSCDDVIVSTSQREVLDDRAERESGEEREAGDDHDRPGDEHAVQR